MEKLNKVIKEMSFNIPGVLRNNKQAILIYWQLFVGGTLFVFGLWTFAIYPKQFLISHFQISLYSWTDIFFNPQMSRFLNYVFAAAGFAFYYLVFFSEPVVSFMLKKADTIKVETRIAISLIIIFVLAFSDFIALPARLITFLFLETVSLLSLFFPEIFPALNLRLRFSRLIKLVPFVFIFFIAIEVISLARGPVLLMNEYQAIYSETRVEGNYVNNRNYLVDVMNAANSGIGAKMFKTRNSLEYSHQNMNRGQIDHISYILNPLNEYYSGKKARDIYFQYGYGNTLFFGYIMRLFGGLSIDNYYKCYLVYLLYAILLLMVLYYVFRNSVYVCGAFSFYIIGFFSTGFIGFILAPGIIPSIHLFDILVIPFLLYYFKKQRAWALISALFLTLAGVFFNNNFGVALFLSTIASLFVFFRENKQIQGRLFFKACILVAGIIFVFLLNSAGGGSDTSFKYNLLGFFSFKPSQGSIVFTTIYFLVSYLFLHFSRNRKEPMKYLFVFGFIYIQFLFLYFFWAGLNSHLLHVVQFAGIQLFIMLNIAEHSRTLNTRGSLYIRRLAYMCAAVAVIFAVVFMGRFYDDPQGFDKKDFSANFTEHRTFIWNLERAHLISTINPQLIKESVSLITKYSPGINSGIYIISKYDNLLPFLAKRYSKLPSFYLQGYLRDKISTGRTVSLILKDLPEYIYVDSDWDSVLSDPWGRIFNERSLRLERQSRFERYGELRKVFDAVKQDYVYVDSAGLLTVYKRDTKRAYVNSK